MQKLKPKKLKLISFNSIKVRLILQMALYQLIPLGFQFHKGSIDTHSEHFLAIASHRFNSIKVRLILSAGRGGAHLSISFNSIKVRLIHSEYKTNYDRFKFQFHKGSIDTNCCLFLLKNSIRFNSIKVRLIPRLLIWILPVQLCFNSIKVRLIRYG